MLEVEKALGSDPNSGPTPQGLSQPSGSWLLNKKQSSIAGWRRDEAEPSEDSGGARADSATPKETAPASSQQTSPHFPPSLRSQAGTALSPRHRAIRKRNQCRRTLIAFFIQSSVVSPRLRGRSAQPAVPRGAACPGRVPLTARRAGAAPPATPRVPRDGSRWGRGGRAASSRRRGRRDGCWGEAPRGTCAESRWRDSKTAVKLGTSSFPGMEEPSRAGRKPAAGCGANGEFAPSQTSLRHKPPSVTNLPPSQTSLAVLKRTACFYAAWELLRKPVPSSQADPQFPGGFADQ